MSTLTLEGIRATALAIVDQEGASRLTMRRVADRLGVEAPSLYHHVDSKGALVDGIVDALLDEVAVPSAGGAAGDSLRALARSLRKVMDAHPNAVRLVGARPSRALSLVGRCEPVLAALAAEGAAPSRALDQLRTVILFVLGHAEVTHGGGPAITADDDSPRVSAALAADTGPDRWFDHGLDAILAGFAQPAASVAPSRSAVAAAAAATPRPAAPEADDDGDEGHAAGEALQDAHDSDDAPGGDQAGRHADEVGQDEDAAAASSPSGDVHGAADEGGAEAHAPGDDQDGEDQDGDDQDGEDDAAAAAEADDHGHDHGHSHDHGRPATQAVPPPPAVRPSPRPTPAPPPAAEQPRGIARRLLRRALRRDDD